MSEYVGLQSQVPNGFERLSQLLSIRRNQTALGMEQQEAHQRAALAKYDWNKHIGADGTIDVASVANDPELRAAAGDQFQDVLAATVNAYDSQLKAKRTLVALRDDQRGALGSSIEALLSDPDVAADNERGRQKTNQALIGFGEAYGDDALPVLSAYSKQLTGVPKGHLRDAIRTIGLQAMSAGAQVQAQQPSFVDTGGQLDNANPLSPQTPPLQKTLAPGAQESVGSDQLGNQFVTSRSPTGEVQGTRPLEAAPTPWGPNSSPSSPNPSPARFGPGERASLEAQAQQNFEQTTANRQAASMAPQQLDQIDKALALSEETDTGGWAEARSKIEAHLGSLWPGFEGMDQPSKLQELDKFTERIATDASRVLGVNAKTDAERESIHKQNANIGYTPQAIRSVLKYAKAQTLAMQAKGDAQEAWLATSGNSITKQHEFETKFRQAYDPTVFQLYVMSPNERKAELAKMSAKERGALKDKAAKLKELGVTLDGG